MPPAARVTDMHTCPMTTGPVPHVGGPILPPGAPTVLIDFLPAATVTSMATCVGPPDMIVMGSMGVMINFLPAARLGDQTAHGGVIVLGSFTCMIGDMGSPSPGAGGIGGIMAGLAMSNANSAMQGVQSKYSQSGTPQSQTAESPPNSNQQQNVPLQFDQDAQTSDDPMQVARDFYRQTGWSDAAIQSHMDCIDETKPVKVITLPPGTVVKQWVNPKKGVGNYFDGDEPPENLGVYPLHVEPREVQSFVVTKETRVLQSTAKGVTVGWMPDIPPQRVPGGGIQMFSLPRDKGNLSKI